MKQYRIRFALPDELGAKYEAIKDKSSFMAEAIKWYLSYGKDALYRLNRIENMLFNGVSVNIKEDLSQKIENDDTDNAFDRFVI